MNASCAFDHEVQPHPAERETELAHHSEGKVDVRVEKEDGANAHEHGARDSGRAKPNDTAAGRDDYGRNEGHAAHFAEMVTETEDRAGGHAHSVVREPTRADTREHVECGVERRVEKSENSHDPAEHHARPADKDPGGEGQEGEDRQDCDMQVAPVFGRR